MIPYILFFSIYKKIYIRKFTWNNFNDISTSFWNFKKFYLVFGKSKSVSFYNKDLIYILPNI